MVLKTDLAWLREQVLTAIRRGDDNAAVQQANLIPPELLAHHPAAQVPYLLLREHLIDRLYDQNVGYWQADLKGINHLTRSDRAEVLVDYLGVTERQLVKALQRLVNDGKYEFAASLLESSAARFGNSASVRKLERLTQRWNWANRIMLARQEDIPSGGTGPLLLPAALRSRHWEVILVPCSLHQLEEFPSCPHDSVI